MDAIAQIFDSIPGILWTMFWGTLLLYWFTDFFGFLRELIIPNSRKVAQLEEKVRSLENQLESTRRAQLAQTEASSPDALVADDPVVIKV